MANVTWKANDGSWSSQLDWSGLAVPTAADTAVFAAADTSTATLDAPTAIAGVQLVAGSGATLLIESDLTLSGSLVVAGGTLDLAQAGTISGGTLDLGAGTLVSNGGTLDGVLVIGPLGNGVAITAATAALTAAAAVNPGTLDVSATLHLVAGAYDAMRFVNVIAAAPFDLAIDAGTVTIGANASIVLSLSDPLHQAGIYPTSAQVSVTGAGTLVNDGLIYSDISTAGPPLQLDVASFVNNGTLQLAALTIPGETQQSIVVNGKRTQIVDLKWNATLAAQLNVGGGSFVNNGTVEGVALLDIESTTFVNTGKIALVDGTTQFPFHNSSQAFVLTNQPLPSQLTIGSASFSNTGTLTASTISIGSNVTLAELGTLNGHVVLTGTLDLQGGTLDIGANLSTRSFSFTGTVRNGVLITEGANLDDAHATLTNVTVLHSALTDITSGAVTLDANAATLTYTSAAHIDGLTVTAGAPGVTDHLIASAAGTLTFGVGTVIGDSIAGTILEIGGPGTFADLGSITLDGSTLKISTTLDGSGTITLTDGASLSLAALAATDTTTIVFGVGHNLLTLPGNASGLGALGITLIGLAPGDVLDFTGLSANPPPGKFATGGAVASNGTLDVSAASGEQASVSIGDAAGLTFAVTSDPNSGTLVTIACFRTGTAIATPGGRMPVEALDIGDQVLTASGASRPIKWIGRRAYSAAVVADQPQLRPVCVMAGALGGGLPTRDLYLSPLHALLLDGVLVPAAALVNGATIIRAAPEAVSYVHIELATAETILAEGAAAETFVDCDSRAMFHNAADYARMYPDEAPRRWRFAAPRVEQGWRLQEIRDRLAGLALAAPHSGRLRGHIDRQGGGVIEGWAMDEEHPAVPVELEMVAHGQHLGCLIANRYRIDLDRAGIGRATHAFVAELPGLDPALFAAVTLHRLSDGATLAR